MSRKKRPFSGGGGSKNMAFAVAALFVCVVTLYVLTEYTRSTESIAYSKFVELVESGQVQEVRIAGQVVQGQLKDDRYFETVAPLNPGGWGLLSSNSVSYSVVNLANQFNMWYILGILALIIAIVWGAWFFARQMKGAGGGGGNNIFTMGKSRAKMFMPSTIKDTFKSVAGADEAKEELQDLVDFLKSPEKYKRLGAKITRGVLLIGAPGNGKTLLARAVAGEANCPFFSISGSDFIEVFVGVGASRVRDLFVQARKNAPCIIFIDEIDAVGRQRGSGLGGGHDEREQTLNQLLTEMDGFQTSDAPVIVIAATNRPDILDLALLRPGRFDKRVNVPYPDLKSRHKILQVHAKPVKIDADVDLKRIARGTPGFTGADLANLINEAALIASKDETRKTVNVLDFEEARDKIILGKEVKTMMQTPEDLKVTAYHEAGHALVRLLSPEHSDPLHKVTIVPRGKALGITHSLPEREKYIRTESEFRADIASAVGGRAAEDLVFNEVTTGAISDFQAASKMVRSMVCKYGMSNVGLAIYGQSQGDFVYSQKTAERIDAEVERILGELYVKAVDMLKQNRDKLDMLSNALLEKETLQASEVYELLGIEPRVEHTFASDESDIEQNDTQEKVDGAEEAGSIDKEGDA